MEKIKIEKLSKIDIEKRGIPCWPIWEKEISKFPWTYDQSEECYILKGEVEVEAEGKKYTIKTGDFVTFAKELSCVWNIKSPIRKHYNFRHC